MAFGMGIRWAVLLATVSLGVVACGSKCVAQPCPAGEAFSEDSCSCQGASEGNGAARNEPSGSAGNASSAAGGAEPASYAVCQPLDPVTSTVVLDPAEIVDAGRDAAGTVYVITDKDSRLRVFVGSETSLSQVFALGTGQGNTSSGEFWTADYNDAQGQLITLEVQQNAGGLRMGVAQGPISGKGFEVGSIGEVLAPIAASDAVTIPTMSTQTFHLEYAGTTANEIVAVIAPDHADTFDTFRIFFGQPEDIAEQSVSMVGRGLSIPSATTITFTIDDGSANGRPASLNYEDGVGELTIDDEKTSLVGAATVPANAVFECR